MALPSLNNIKKRTVIIVVCVFVCFALVILRMAWWQIIRGAELAQTAKNQQTTNTVEQAARGKILDRNGKVLAESASVKTLVCNPMDIKNHGDIDVCVDVLAPILDMDSDTLYKYLSDNSQYRVIKKRLSAEESNAISEIINPTLEDGNSSEIKAANKEKTDLQSKLYGVYFENDSKRYYPYNVASHVIGFTGYDNNGIQGVELRFNEYLAGLNGYVAQNRSASGTTSEQQAEYLTASMSGCDVTLTIDETIQHFLEKHLEEAVKENELKEGAAGIIMNPKTGEILAIATKPDFDCNNPYDLTQFLEYAIDFEPVYEDEETDGEDEDEKATPRPTEDPENPSDEFVSQARSKMWRDKAVSDTYEPGSTFKMITAAAALEEDLVTEESTFFCAGYKQVADRKISCSNESGHGPETFVDGVKNSCNPVFMELGARLGADKFMEYFKSFGFTQKTGVDLGGESSSIYYNEMSEVDLAVSSFGQGFQITPIQLITAVSAVVNGGERMKPLIVKEITNADGIVKKYEPEVVNRVISEDTSERMRAILEQVVADPAATGKNAYVNGYRIGGKTATSEKYPRGTDKRIASFVGFAPANDPELICLVMFDEPQVDNKYGGTIAAPVCGEILSECLDYLGVPKQYDDGTEAETLSIVPELRNSDLDAAKKKISDAGLNYVVKGDGETVVDQLPLPDERLTEDSIVIVYTEEHDENALVAVPDLTGTSVSDARDILNGRGLNFEISGAGHSESYNAYAVSQSVEPGVEVAPGTVIGVEFRQQTSD